MMRKDDKIKFGQLMALMAENFQKKPTRPMTDLYWRVLKDMPIESFERACLHLINTRTITGTFPLVAEIRKAVEVSPDSRAIFAWEKFWYAFKNHCPYDSVLFDDPIIPRIVESWGDWPSMGDWPERETTFRRQEFMKLYKTYLEAGALSDKPKPLIGLVEAHNANKGYLEFIPEIVRIGEHKGKCQILPPDHPVSKRLEAAGMGIE